jgi:hypothetical protein
VRTIRGLKARVFWPRRSTQICKCWCVIRDGRHWIQSCRKSLEANRTLQGGYRWGFIGTVGPFNNFRLEIYLYKDVTNLPMVTAKKLRLQASMFFKLTAFILGTLFKIKTSSNLNSHPAK